jgi:hypothetical protein
MSIVHVHVRFTCEHVPSDLVHQDHLLLVRDDLWLGELVEPSASLEEERVPLDKVLDAALVLHMQHL